MLVGYYDESGTHANSPAVCVAGLVLDEFGITIFHMTDWEKRSKEFKGWDDEKRIELFQRLVLVLRKTFRRGFSAPVNLSDYDNERFKSIRPYVFRVLQCLRSVGAWAKNAGLSEPIAHRLETGAGYNRAVDFVRQYILEERKRKDFFWFGSIALASNEECNLLQTADILAYESWKEVCNSNVPNCPGRPIREPARFLWENIRISTRDSTLIRDDSRLTLRRVGLLYDSTSIHHPVPTEGRKEGRRWRRSRS